MPSPRRERKPWPMKWVGLIIVVFIAAYTYLTLHYRKPGPEYRPYEDMKQRANTGRLLAAGYQRIELAAQLPVRRAITQTSALPAPGGLPAELQTTIVDPPLLPADIVDAYAAAHASSREPYNVEFRCTVPDDRRQLAGAELYVRRDTIVITPDFQILAPGLLTRTRDLVVQVTVPAGALKAGTYRVTLIGQRRSQTWMLRIQ